MKAHWYLIALTNSYNKVVNTNHHLLVHIWAHLWVRYFSYKNICQRIVCCFQIFEMVEIQVCGLDEHTTYALDFVGLISLAQPCLNWSLMRSPVYACPTAVSHHRVPDRDVVLALLHELRQSRIFRRRMLSLYADTPLVISVGNWSAPRFCTGVWSSLVLQLIYRHAQASLMMSWLSTLGGAFSSLGDTDSKSVSRFSQIT